MRADRLLSILMLLQGRGRMTAGELAGELEVSVRTIYRDIDALSIAGVPVYGEAGPAGGYGLIDSYRTNLTGLTEGEVRALFMLSIPAPLADLGLDQELRAAMWKLSAALPDGRRSDEEWIRQRLHLDSTWWRHGQEMMPHMQTVHQAVWQDRKLFMTYHPIFTLEIKRLVAPYGLVAKGGIWYLVYAQNEGLHVQRVSKIVDVQLADEPFERPPDFDLRAFWGEWCMKHEESLSNFKVTVRVAPDFIPLLPMYFGNQIRSQLDRSGSPDGGITLDLFFESLEAARERILDFGRGVEVLEPQALRRSVLDYAEQIVSLYSRDY